MNQTELNSFLNCLSRLVASDNDHRESYRYDSLENSMNATSGAFASAALPFIDGHRHGDDDPSHDHDHDHDEDSGDNNIIVAKATAMCVLFFASTICGSVPFLLNRFFKWSDNNTNARSATTVKCLLYFGGGVLLCTTFMHLLPEVEETVEQLQECETLPELNFHLAQLLMCLGFFAMYLIEELIHAYLHRHRKNLKDESTAAFERGHSIRNSYLVRNTNSSGNRLDSFDKAQLTQTSTIGKLSAQDLLAHDENEKYQPSITTISVSGHELPYIQSHSHGHGHSHDHSQGHSHLPLDDDDDNLVTSSLRGLLIVLALSLHELFEGMAIGLEGSATNVWFMFAAVSAHKLILAFCVGVELIVARTRLFLSIIYVITFAIVSPIGIGIGLLVSTDGSTASSIPSAILQGLACGTLLYVVFFEILSKNRSGHLAYLSLFVGFAVMFGLQQITEGHEHSHGHCESHDHEHNHGDESTNALILEKQLQIIREASSNLKEMLRKNNS